MKKEDLLKLLGDQDSRKFLIEYVQYVFDPKSCKYDILFNFREVPGRFIELSEEFISKYEPNRGQTYVLYKDGREQLWNISDSHTSLVSGGRKIDEFFIKDHL